MDGSAVSLVVPGSIIIDIIAHPKRIPNQASFAKPKRDPSSPQWFARGAEILGVLIDEWVVSESIGLRERLPLFLSLSPHAWEAGDENGLNVYEQSIWAHFCSTSEYRTMLC